MGHNIEPCGVPNKSIRKTLSVQYHLYLHPVFYVLSMNA